MAPILTIFIGGNHEASNYLQELPYGGWVAPNIYYLGYAGVVKYKGIRIGGLSGIYKGFDYYKGHFEYPPYNENTKRSVYHYRQQETFRLKQLSEPIDIMMSHDWPRGVTRFGNEEQLCRFKPHFLEEIRDDCLGSPPCFEVLKQLKPKYWFSGHLHCKFSAIVPHENGETKFLALDKCLPNRRFLQLIDVETDENASNGLEYDLEWLTILHITKHLTSVKPLSNYMPGPGDSNVRWNFVPSAQEKEFVLKRFGNSLEIPKNFEPTAEAYDPDNQTQNPIQPRPTLNPQTTLLCDLLDIEDPVSVALAMCGDEFNDRSFMDNLNETDGFNCQPPDGDKADGTDDADEKDSTELNTSMTSTTARADGMTPLKKRLSLLATLPPPKNDSAETFEDIDNLAQLNKSNSGNDSFINDTVCSIDSTSNEPNNEAVDKTLNQEEAEGENTPVKKDTTENQSSASKKFIRRNASIYNAETDD